MVTPPHLLFEEVKKEAALLYVAVTGSEIVGVVPLDALLQAADYYIQQENLFVLKEDQKVRLAIIPWENILCRDLSGSLQRQGER